MRKILFPKIDSVFSKTSKVLFLVVIGCVLTVTFFINIYLFLGFLIFITAVVWRVYVQNKKLKYILQNNDMFKSDILTTLGQFAFISLTSNELRILIFKRKVATFSAEAKLAGAKDFFLQDVYYDIPNSNEFISLDNISLELISLPLIDIAKAATVTYDQVSKETLFKTMNFRKNYIFGVQIITNTNKKINVPTEFGAEFNKELNKLIKSNNLI